MKNIAIVLSALFVSAAVVAAAYLLRPMRYTFETCDALKTSDGRVLSRQIRVYDGRTGRFSVWHSSHHDGRYVERNLSEEAARKAAR